MQVRNIGFQKSLINKLGRLSSRLEVEAETELKVSFGLTFSQFKIIDALSRCDEVTQRGLADIIGVTPAVVTKQAEILADRGLILQELNPRSRREKLLRLTEKGQKAATDAGKSVVMAQNRVFVSLDLQLETALDRAVSAAVKVI